MLTYLRLKQFLPELNIKIITPEKILNVLRLHNIEYAEIAMRGRGCYVNKDGKDYVFLKSAMTQFLHHETLSYEAAHALTHFPADFLFWRHNLEAEVLSLICMIPKTHLKRLNRIKHQLDADTYDLLMKRNLSQERWKL